MKQLIEYLTESVSWIDATKGCVVVHIEKRRIAIVPKKGNFPASSPAHKRDALLARCGFTNIYVENSFINGKDYEYLVATIPQRWKDYTDIETIADKIKQELDESSSLFHDVISPYEFDMEKSLANSRFSIRVHKYENGELVLNDDYLETDNLKKFRSVLKKIAAFQEFSKSDIDKYKMSAHWGSLEEPRDVIYLTLYVSGQYNTAMYLVIDLQSNNVYELDDPFKNIKWPRRRDTDKLLTFTPRILWDGHFI